MANQNFRIKNGLEVGGVEVVNSSGSVNTSSFPTSGVSAGTVGNTTTIPVITVDARGLVTNIQSASVSGVSNYTYTSSNSTFVLSTGDGSNFAQTIPTANSSTLGLIKVGSLLTVNATGFINLDEGNIDHDQLTGFVSNEHIDHSTVSVTAGNGLSGGGDITATRTIAVVAGNTQVISNSSGVFIDESEIDIHNLSGYVANEHIDHSTVSVTAGNGLSGGGTIAATRTIDVVGNTGITSNSSGIFTNDSEIVHDNLSGFVSNEHIDHSSVTLTAGNGLSGGGDITTNRSFAVGAGNGISVNSTAVAVKANTGITSNSSGIFTNDSEIVHDNLSGFVSNEHIDHSTVSVTAGNGLSGGGDITATRTLAVGAGNGISVNSTAVAVKANTGIVANSTGVFTNDSQIVHDNLSGFVANEHIDHSSVSISAGNGLSGGGDLTSTRSLAVVGNTALISNSSGVHVAAGDGLTANSTDLKVTAGTGVTVNATGVHIGQDVSTTANVTFSDVIVSGNLTINGTQTTIDTNNLVVNDAIITVASGQTGVPALDAGIEVERGDSANALLVWDESQDRWIQKLAGGTEYVLHTKQHDIALGTDTSGNYIDDISAGNGIAVTHTPGEGSDPSIAVVANTGITSNSSGIFTNDSEIVHDNLSGFVANEHIDHSSVSISAGNGLTGGGTIAATRTLAVGAGNGISVNSTAVAVAAGNNQVVSNSTGVFINEGNIDIHNLSGYVANENIDHSGVTLTAGNGLTGGGNITTSRSFAVGAGNGISVNSTAVAVSAGSGIASNATGVHVVAGNNQVVSNSTGVFINESNIDIHNLSGYVANENIDHSSVNLTAGNGLTGGGTIAASRSFAVNAGDGVVVNATGVHVAAGNGLDVNSTSLSINDSTIRGLFSAGGDLSYNSTTGQFSFTNDAGDIESVTAGNGLTGGGTTGALTLTVGAGNGISVNSTAVAVAAGNNQVVSNSSGVFIAESNIDIHNLSGYVANENIDHSSVTLTAGNGLSGGGDITTNRSFAVLANTGLVSNSTGVHANSAYIRGLISAGGDLSYDSGTGVISFTNDAGDIEGVTAGDGLTGGGTTGTVTVTVGAGNGISVNSTAVAVKANTGLVSNSSGVFTNDSQIVHDSLSGFVANEHIDHSGVTLTAGNGLSGGGNITASRSFAVLANTGIVANSTGVFTNDSQIVHDSLSGFVSNEHIDHSSVTLTAGNGLTGGGDITASRSFAVAAGNNQVVSNSTGVFINESNIDIHNLSGYVAGEHIDHATVSITAGNGLTGGGDISSTRSLAVVAGNTQLISNASGIFANQANFNHNALSNYVSNQHIDHSSVSITAGNGLSGGGTIAATRTINVVGNTGITANSTGVFTNDSQIVHDNLSGFVSNEHIDHSAVSITAGNGLTGGGTIAATRTLTVGAGNGISVNSTAVAVSAGNGIASNATGVHVVGGTGVTSNSTGVHIGQSVGTSDNVTFADVTISGNLTVSGTQTTLNTTELTVNDSIITLLSGHSGAPALDAGLEINRGTSANALIYWDESTDRWTHRLSGGTEYVFHTKANDIVLGTDTSGNYIDNVTAGNGISVSHTPGEGSEPSIAVKANTGIIANSSGIFADASNINHDNLSGFVANEHIDHSSVSITAGNGLTGGGNITTTRTLSVVGGTGVTSNSTGVHIGQSVGTSDSVTFASMTASANAIIANLYDSSNRVLKVYNDTGTVVWG